MKKLEVTVICFITPYQMEQFAITQQTMCMWISSHHEAPELTVLLLWTMVRHILCYYYLKFKLQIG